MNKQKILIGYDIGSSSVKASFLDADTGTLVKSTFFPETEMKIESPQPGFAEQQPENWWNNLVRATKSIIATTDFSAFEIAGIGISYQMHGLVMVDENQNVLYPSIIWCDSRAVDIGQKAFNTLGKEFCLTNYLNSPGNFTASKLRWVKENEPEIFSKIYKIMLPGEYIAMKLSGEILTTKSGLSEGLFWDFKNNKIASELLDYYELDPKFLPNIVDTFSHQGKLTVKAANELGLTSGIPIGYRAGDQPNNAFSLNVLNPGEIASTAGTSGVVYGITDKNLFDEESRVNAFAHVNYTDLQQNKGVLLCINGTGILNSWLRNELLDGRYSYDELNELAAKVPIGSEGILSYPYGNGAERSLGDKEYGGQFLGLNLIRHGKAELLRSSQEGIAFAFKYGIDIMKDMGMKIDLLRAGNANMFLSPIFREAIANVCDVNVELYSTDGSIGAARGAGVGVGIYNSYEEAFKELKVIRRIEPDKDKKLIYDEVYNNWKEKLLLDI